MTQEKANEIFDTEIGQQLLEIYVTPNDIPFIRLEEAYQYCKYGLKLGDDPSKYGIEVFYPEDITLEQ